MSAKSNQLARHSRRLGVMEKHDISFSDPTGEAGNIRLGDPLEVIGLIRAEAANVSGHTVEAVVDALRDREELSISGHHQPADVYARVLDIADEHVEHLGHPTSGGGRTNIPDSSAVESLCGLNGCTMEVGESLRADQRFES